MKFLAAIAGVLLLQGTIARAQPTQQCSVQSDYPSPLDANGKPIGALVQVDLSSQVGVVLDDLPAAKRADVAQWLLSQGTDYWKAGPYGRSRWRITGSTSATTTSATREPCRFRSLALDIFLRHGEARAVRIGEEEVRRRCRAHRLPDPKRHLDRLQLAERFDGQQAEQARRNRDDAVRIALDRSLLLQRTGPA